MREEGYTEEEIVERFEELRQELRTDPDITYPNRIDEEFMRMGFGNE